LTITCRKIGKTPLDFSFEATQEENLGAKIEGSLVHKSGSLIALNAKLSGKLLRTCDVCCEEVAIPLDEKLELLISDGVYSTQNHELEDVVEVENGVIKIEDILHSELELIRSDYFVCEKCEASEGEFEF